MIKNEYLMKKILIISSLFLGLQSIPHAQELRLGINTGLIVSASNYYDIQIDPQKVFFVNRPTAGMTLEYSYGKKNKVYVASGIHWMQAANAFKVESTPYFFKNQGFEKVAQNYTALKIPLRIGYGHTVKEKLEIRFFIGAAGLFINWNSFEKLISEESKAVINEVPYTLDYEYEFRSTSDGLALETGLELNYPLNDKFLLTFSLSQQIGTFPILGSILNYEILREDDRFGLLGDAYVTTKGDAIFIMIGIAYRF